MQLGKEGGNAFCVMLQTAAAIAAKSTTASGKGTVSTNVADYKEKDLQAAFASATVTTSVLLELIAYRKTVLGAHHADKKPIPVCTVCGKRGRIVGTSWTLTQPS